MEEWLPIKNFSKYEISTLGQIRNIKTGKILKQRVNRKNYNEITLSDDDGGRQIVYIHRLVAETFLNSYMDGKYYVAHKDRDRRNNSVDNLKWCTRKEFSELSDIYFNHIRVRIVELDKSFDSISDCAKYLGCDPKIVGVCIHIRQKAYKGLHFERI